MKVDAILFEISCYLLYRTVGKHPFLVISVENSTLKVIIEILLKYQL